MLKHSPSMLAAAAIYLSNKIVKKEEAWNKDAEIASQYNEAMIRPCAKDLCILLQGVETCVLKAVQKKFRLTRYEEVGKLRLSND